MESHVVSNLVAGLLVLLVVGALVAASRSDIWREAGRQLVRRRPIALAAVAARRPAPPRATAGSDGSARR